MALFHVLISTSLRSGRRERESGKDDRGEDDRGEEISGSLLLATVDSQKHTCTVLRQLELPPSPHRLGRNSVRGVAEFAGGYIACNTTQMFALDQDLRRIEASVSDRRFGDIHSVAVRGRVIYVTATASDSVLDFDHNLHKCFEWWAGEEPELAREMTEHPRQAMMWDHDFRYKGPYYNRFHINHVCFADNGDLIVNLPNMPVSAAASKFWNVTARRFHLLPGNGGTLLDGRVHDGHIMNSIHYLNYTATGEFIKLDCATARVLQRVDCRVPLPRTTGDALAIENGWLRGAALLHDELFLIGQSKLTLFLVDMARGQRSEPLVLKGFNGDINCPGLAIYCIAKADHWRRR
ncbi:MAG: hypothetical protein GKR94_00440 [Gammaproteobacteria bacterium]|nr:hypothetical protein [Gammaproteobacteria bacterium]